MDYVKPHLTVLLTAQQVFLDLAADPQTSGGLLVALPREDAEPLLRELQTFAPWSAIVGEVSELRAPRWNSTDPNGTQAKQELNAKAFSSCFIFAPHFASADAKHFLIRIY